MFHESSTVVLFFNVLQIKSAEFQSTLNMSIIKHISNLLIVTTFQKRKQMPSEAGQARWRISRKPQQSNTDMNQFNRTWLKVQKTGVGEHGEG